MSGFSIAWLDLREAADRRARDVALLQRVQSWLHAQPEPCILDLGAGTGATLRATQLHQAEWHLVDFDPALLAEAQRRHGAEFIVHTHHCDLLELAALPFAQATLVTASALFDLCSALFCDALVARLAAHGLPLYAALSYDGHMSWSAAHPLDAEVTAAFNRDQLRDKGFGGPALGPDAVAYLQESLRKQGYTVRTARSPWVLGPADAALVEELCRGCAAAVAAFITPAALHEWLDFRLAQARSGSCIVGHLDLWAYPST